MLEPTSFWDETKCSVTAQSLVPKMSFILVGLDLFWVVMWKLQNSKLYISYFHFCAINCLESLGVVIELELLSFWVAVVYGWNGLYISHGWVVLSCLLSCTRNSKFIPHTSDKYRGLCKMIFPKCYKSWELLWWL